ncbi:hypothetical protein [Prosthecomicrobium sp. N25]|uniref:hypothetical protein n=1 Tax=Prosthecomicrobium sp. N25 TaxID=3129254 RepID=UPI003077B31E
MLAVKGGIGAAARATALVLAMVAGGGAAMAAELEAFSYGRWTGSAITDDFGSFSRCSVSGRFKRASASSGREIAAAVTMDRTSGWTLGIVGAQGGESAPAQSFRLSIDGRSVIESRPEAAGDQIAVFVLPDPPGTIDALRKGHTLTVTAEDDTYDLALAGIGRALDWVEACAKRYATFVSPGREKATSEAAVLRKDISGLMEKLFASVDAKNVRVGPPPGIPDIPSEDKTVGWRAEGLHGEGQVWSGRNARALADRIIGSTEGCKRRPATRKPAKGEKVILELVDCLDPSGARRVGLVLMPRGKGGIYLISVHSREGSTDAVDRLGEQIAESARRTELR